MRLNKLLVFVVAMSAVLCGKIALSDTDKSTGPVFKDDGTVEVPAFELPPSSFLSPEALALQKSRAAPHAHSAPAKTIEEYRKVHDAALEKYVEAMRERFPTTMVEAPIAGIRTRTFTPRDKPVDPKRVLINIHGGGFVGCEGACSQLESIPIASVGGFKVVSVLYRMAPEAVFPAGPEDITRVYQELMKTYKPGNIGIFGCSAGGQLTAQTTAWLASHSVARPGAIGIFGAGGAASEAIRGDSNYLAAAIDAGSAPARMDTGGGSKPIRSYFEGSDLRGSLVSPMLHPDVLAKFPPTLFITSTRAADLSNAVYGHSQLVKAGVPGDLIVAEGLGHCYLYAAQLPESQDAYEAVVRFFRANLGH